MDHPFMTRVAEELASRGVATLRYNFPYMERGSRRPDTPAIAHAAVSSAVATAKKHAGTRPLLAGGKSFGGRMTSQAVALGETSADGLVFLGFPLHPPGKPSLERAQHLEEVTVPMLFLQGSRDALAKRELVQEVADQLSFATLRFFEGADHSFKAGKADLIPTLADEIRAWIPVKNHRKKRR